MKAPLVFHEILDTMFERIVNDGLPSVTAKVMDTDPDSPLPPFALTLDFQDVRLGVLDPNEKPLGVESLDIQGGKVTRTVLA